MGVVVGDSHHTTSGVFHAPAAQKRGTPTENVHRGMQRQPFEFAETQLGQAQSKYAARAVLEIEVRRPRTL